MMISPDYYRNTIIDYDIDDLVKERNKLLREISRFERNEISEDEKCVSPSPLTIYQCNNEYLIEVTKLINERILEMREMIDIKNTQRLNLKDTGFRAVYKNFVAYPLTDAFKAIIQNFPNSERANCVLCYGYIDLEAGLTLDVLACGKMIKDGFLFFETAEDTRSIIRIASVMNQDFYYIHDEYDDLLDKYEDRLEIIKHYDANEELEETRKMDFLDSCRHIEYPDDVMVYLLRDNYEIERCWVRTIGHGENFITGNLLNEPNQDFGFHKGQLISYFCQKTENNEIICCSDMNPSFKLTIEELEGGELLKKTIHKFNGERNEHNFIDVLTLLRDSYVWIPCKAILGDNDYNNLNELINENMEDLNRIKEHIFSNTEDIRMVPDILQNGDDYFFPVFSNCAEMGEYGNHFSKMEKHFLEAIILAKNNDRKVKGIVINAFTEPFVLETELFDLIEKAQSNIVE